MGWIRHQLICEFLDKFRIKAKLSEKSIIFAASTEGKMNDNVVALW
jgi:hypothetical protein